MEDLLECNICMESFEITGQRIPKLLACQHSFCVSCLTAILKGKWLCCPVCRRKHACKNVEDLQNNLYVMRLLDLRKGKKIEKRRMKKCEKCLQMTERCKNCCNHSMCGTCSSQDMERRMKEMEKTVQQVSATVSKLQNTRAEQRRNENKRNVRQTLQESPLVDAIKSILSKLLDVIFVICLLVSPLKKSDENSDKQHATAVLFVLVVFLVGFGVGQRKMNELPGNEENVHTGIIPARRQRRRP